VPELMGSFSAGSGVPSPAPPCSCWSMTASSAGRRGRTCSTASPRNAITTPEPLRRASRWRPRRIRPAVRATAALL